MSLPLRERHAKRGRVPKLTVEELAAFLPELSAWTLLPTEPGRLERVMTFATFAALMVFVDRMAALAEAENHHPDFAVHYNRLTVTLWTHDAGGITENDAVLAARIDALG